MWSEKWGLLDPEDHAKKMQIEQDEADLRARQEKEAAKRAEAKKVKPKPDVIAIEAEADVEVVRADSGMAKVKPKK
jgi:hypothetical protein